MVEQRDVNLRALLRFVLVCGFISAFLPSAVFAATSARSCDALFAASEPSTAQGAMGIIEPIASIYTGSQLYSVVLGSAGETGAGGNVPGLYRRDQRSWKILIPGEIMLDEQGAPLLTQLSLAKTDKNSYVVTVIDGNIHLLTGHSDPAVPSTMIQFGTKDSPLFEVGSMQKRYLPTNEKEARVSIYQNPTLSSNGSQLVLVSVKFNNEQPVGEGMTFAFEVMPTKDSKDISLNGKAMIIDYDFHETAELNTFVTGSTDKIIFSKILFEQFRETDLSYFGSHVEWVRQLLTEFANKILGAVSPSMFLQSPSERVAYNITAGKVEKDVMFKRAIFRSPRGGTTFEQQYTVSRGKSELYIAVEGQEFRLEGRVDLLADGKPAIWLGENQIDVFFVKDGVVNALVQKTSSTTEVVLVELGNFAELFPYVAWGTQLPTDVHFSSYLPRSTEPIEKGFIIISAKGSAGTEMTGVIRLNMFYGKSLQKIDSYQLLNFALTSSELSARVRGKDGTEPLFDSVTPRAESTAAYEQIYDASKPHVNLLGSSLGQLAYKFKQPNRVMPIAAGIAYAEFSETPGVENPSGIYFNLAPDKVTGNEADKVVGQLVPRSLRATDEAHPEKQFIYAKIETSAKRGSEPKEEDSYEDHHGTGHKLMLLAVDAKRRSGKDGYQLVLASPNSKNEIKTRSLNEFARQGWLRSPDYLKHAQFIQGRRGDRDFVYLFLSFRVEANGQVVERTFVYRINTSKPDESPKMSMIDGLLLEAKDIQERVGFDEDGVPSIILSPDLSPDAHQFSVFDLKNAAKDFPNQTFGAGKKKFKFGEVKGSGAQSEDSYVSSTDSWSASAFEVKKKYPSLGRSSDLAQFDSFVSLGKQLDQMSMPKNPAERMILVVPESLRELVWDFILNKGFSGDREYGPGSDTNQGANKFTHVNRRLKIDLLDPQKASQEQFFANIENWSKLKFSKPTERVFGLARLDEMLQTQGAIPNPRESAHAFALNYVAAAVGTDLTQVATQQSARYPSALYLIAAEKPVQLREFRNLKDDPSASFLLLATPEEMKTLETALAPEIENGLLERFKIQEIKDPDPESMSMSLAEIFHNPDLQSLDFQFSAKEIKPRAILDSEQSFEVVIDYAISRFSFWLGQKKESRFESFMRFRAAFAQAVLSDKEVRRTRIVNKAFVERVLTQVFDIPMNLLTLPADDPMVIAARQDFLLLWQEAGHSGLFDLKGKIRDTVLSQTRADAGKPVPSSTMLFGATGSGKTKVFLTLIKALRLKLYDFSNLQNNTDASAIIINVGQLKETGGSNREGDMSVDQALAHLDALLSTPNGYRSWILFDDVHAAPDAVKAKILGWQRSLFEAQNGMYTIAGSSSLRRPIRNLNIFMTLNPTADQDQIARYAKDKLKPTQEEILLATLSSASFKIEPSFLRRWGRIVNLDFMPAGAKGPELLKNIALASNSLLNTHSRIVLVDPTVVSRLVADNEQVDARTFLSTATSALVEVASAENTTGALVLVVPAMGRLSPKGLPMAGNGLETSPAEKITNWVFQNTRTLSLDASLVGNLAFTKLIVDAFRTPIYESLTMALQEDPRLAGTPNDQKNMLAPILAAIADHLADHSYVSLRDLNVNASDFGMKTPSERELFRAALAKMTANATKPLYPQAFQEMESSITTWQSIEGGADSAVQTNTRKNVLAELVLKNRQILRQRMAEVMRVSDFDVLPDPARWLVDLGPDSPSNPKEVGRSLAENLLGFLPKIFDGELIDNRIPDAPALTIYAATRLYLHSVDRAMTQMQWVRPSKFLLKSLELITEDQVLSQKPGVQSFLFTDPQRLIKPSIPDFTFQIIASSHALEEVPAETREKQRVEFATQVDRLISPTSQPKAE